MLNFMMIVLTLFAAIVLSNIFLTTVYVIVQAVRQGGLSASVFPDGHEHHAREARRV